MRRPVSRPSLLWATGQDCAEVEIAALRLDQCAIYQRAGSITLVDAKGGKTRTLDLHNMARWSSLTTSLQQNHMMMVLIQNNGDCEVEA
jgi:hypothetical protein